MENQFTFTESPEMTVLNHALDLMPGLLQVDLMVKNNLQKSLYVFSLKEKDGNIQQLQLGPDLKQGALLFFNELKNISWFQKSDLPYDTMEFKKTKGDLFAELDKNILIVPIKSIYELPELLYIFNFRKNASELGPVSSESVLDTSHKQLLSRLLSNSLKVMLNSIVENRKVMLEYNEVLMNLIKSKDLEIEKQRLQSDEFEAYLSGIIDQFVNDVSNRGFEFVIPEVTRKLLYPHLSNPDLIRKQLVKALNFAQTLHFMKPQAKLELLPEYFNDLRKSGPGLGHKVDVQTDIYSSHTKTYQFLQSLEEAAHRIIQKGGKLTSINVGQELEQPVTAAAISDKLKNHAYKIHLLLEQFPDMWPIVRNQFRPVINIQEKQIKEKFAS